MNPEQAPLRVLDLFSGIGGFSLGLERTGGFETVAFCEIEEFPRKVLKKHWPDVEVFEDVTNLKYKKDVDLVTAGFPCQDISLAGKGAGLSGERSGLFWYILRTACMVGRPRLLLENVAALLNRGLSTVLGALASFGYDAEWHCISAAHVGAPHIRDRIWIVADSQSHRGRCKKERNQTEWKETKRPSSGISRPGGPRIIPDTYGDIIREQSRRGRRQDGKSSSLTEFNGEQGHVAHTDSKWESQSKRVKQEIGRRFGNSSKQVPNTNVIDDDSRRHGAGTVLRGQSRQAQLPRSKSDRAHRWPAEPTVCGMGDGLSDGLYLGRTVTTESAPKDQRAMRVHRLKGLGNAVVPKIPEIIGYAILEAHYEA